uniref:Lysosomal-associated transmembrane protein 4A n=2 Tax=Caenorhabditis tropicalis TaxID=1561998 RepID=A0A1I7UYW6_9PELO
MCLRMCAFFSFIMTIASGYLVYQHASQTEQVCLRKCIRTEDYFHTQLAIICGIQVLNCVISIVYSLLCLKKSPKNQAYNRVKMEPEELPVTI